MGPERGTVQGTPFRLGYRPAFDGLRGIAVLTVMAYHTYTPLTRGGFIGVDVFFVLSGFLITTLLLQEWDQNGAISLKNFYARRALRLLPALLTLSLVWLLYISVFRPEHLTETSKAVLIVLFYCANWAKAFGHGELGWRDSLGHTWSLSALRSRAGWVVLTKLRGIVRPSIFMYAVLPRASPEVVLKVATQKCLDFDSFHFFLLKNFA